MTISQVLNMSVTQTSHNRVPRNIEALLISVVAAFLLVGALSLVVKLMEKNKPLMKVLKSFSSVYCILISLEYLLKALAFSGNNEILIVTGSITTLLCKMFTPALGLKSCFVYCFMITLVYSPLYFQEKKATLERWLAAGSFTVVLVCPVVVLVAILYTIYGTSCVESLGNHFGIQFTKVVYWIDLGVYLVCLVLFVVYLYGYLMGYIRRKKLVFRRYQQC